MSDQSDDRDIICPYCQNAWQAEAADYSDEETTRECDECGKEFIYYTQFDVAHHTMKIKEESK